MSVKPISRRKAQAAMEFLMSRKRRFLRLENSRGQAAMEFLMTYGWVIFMVMIAIGALSYWGVLDSDRFLPTQCTLPVELTCMDFKVDPTEVVLVLKNSMGYGVTISNITVTANTGSTCDTINPIALQPQGQAIFTLTECDNGVVGADFRGDVSITFSGGPLAHSIEGMISTPINAITSTSSGSICQTAEDDTLCLGLDVVYGQGYQAACCSEHALCC